ncbi:hypothetical protein BOTBODRAFT_61117 [Botryobasidium botryosum FD-172 SS1]|uniref:Serine hydrolase domain-containing protein n=1 Tax=Botryobasidium botryosum (strain FD-172 SS1) TaxID=930990 RepID=A0A067N386_BOTB1|nr:hypothetical protein BOTBODRAFT_61117 [Botryobasidium botryosum FD-172 SS1]
MTTLVVSSQPTEVRTSGAFKRASKLAADEKKVFILHDELQNATLARLQTQTLASGFHKAGIVPYYRNAPFSGQSMDQENGQELEESEALYPCTWLGANESYYEKAVLFIRNTIVRKGPFFGIIALGRTTVIAEMVAEQHGVPFSEPPRELEGGTRSISSYPVAFVTSHHAFQFFVPTHGPPTDSDLALPVDLLIGLIKEAIVEGKKLFDFRKPTFEELRALKREKKKAALAHAALQREINGGKGEKQGDSSQQIPLGVDGTLGVPGHAIEGASGKDAPIATTSPADAIYPFRADSKDAQNKRPKQFSNYLLFPTAEPVTPCPVSALQPMIDWLALDRDIHASEEPRVDFTRGSILGKTTRGGGTSVDLCKQVVGPEGIGPILDAVGMNSHVDRFLLGNNIVGDSGARVIAEFMANPEKSKRVYNFYIAGNSISSKGISHITDALTFNKTVTALWLKRNPLGPAGGARLGEALCLNTTLTTLDLVNTGISDAGAQSIFAALSQNSGSALRHLYMGASAHGVATAQAAGRYLSSGRSKLASLYLSMSRFGDEGAEILASGLAKDKNLERLGLSSCGIGNEGAMRLADALADHPSLVSLDLGWRRGTYELGEEGNKIGDKGALYLGEKLLVGRRRLRSIDLSNNALTYGGAAEFVKRFVIPNEELLVVRIAQKGGQKRNVGAERIAGDVCKRNRRAFDRIVGEEEKARVEEALEPQHIKEIYSIYRGNM